MCKNARHLLTFSILWTLSFPEFGRPSFSPEMISSSRMRSLPSLKSVKILSICKISIMILNKMCCIRGLQYMTWARGPCHCHKSADCVPFICFLGTPHPLRKSYMEAPYIAMNACRLDMSSSLFFSLSHPNLGGIWLKQGKLEIKLLRRLSFSGCPKINPRLGSKERREPRLEGDLRTQAILLLLMSRGTPI